MEINNTNLIGKEILIERGLLKEIITITKVEKIVTDVYSVHGFNSKRTMTMTMHKDEIQDNLIIDEK